MRLRDAVNLTLVSLLATLPAVHEVGRERRQRRPSSFRRVCAWYLRLPPAFGPSKHELFSQWKALLRSTFQRLQVPGR